MYHIKNDKRAITSAELIYQGLSELLERNSLEKITITDIQRISSVSRATFYRSFDSIADVLFWKCDKEFATMAEGFLLAASSKQSAWEPLKIFLDFWMKNSLVLEQLIKINRLDVIYQCHYDHSFEISKQYYKEVPIDGDYDYFIAMRSGLFLSIILTWIRHGKRETLEELLVILSNQLRIFEGSEFIL